MKSIFPIVFILFSSLSCSLTVDEYENSIDYSCKENSDCKVKNIGNCCGYEPRCVNRDSFADQNKLVEACGNEGIVSGCGFAEVDICECIQNKCVGDSVINRGLN